MALRVPWDKYETALLLDACIKVEQKKILKKDAITIVSRELRQRAISKGMMIDEVFRNENGISMQLSIIERLLHNKKGGLQGISQVFKDTVELFHNDKETFNKILDEAQSMSANMNLDIPAVFTSHIEKKEPHNLLKETSNNPMQDMDMIYQKRSVACPHDNFMDYLLNTQHLATTTCRSYVSAINSCEHFIEKSYNSQHKFYGNDDYSLVKEAIIQLSHDKAFCTYNEQQHNRLSAAMKKYLEFISFKGEQKENLLEADIQEDVDFEPYKVILTEKYRKGFRISSKLEMKRFRNFWFDRYGTELIEDDETISSYIKHVTIQHQGFAYLPDTMLDGETQKQVFSYITSRFNEGKTTIYFDALYNEFVEKFKGQRINNPDMLKTYLDYFNRGQYYINRSCLSLEKDAEFNPTDEIRDYLITCGIPVSTDVLVGALSHISKNKIFEVIAGSNSAEFVRNQKGVYFHADIVDFTQVELDIIIEFIQQAIDEKSYMGDVELTEIISKKLPGISERYSYLTGLGLRDAIAYKLCDVFSFKGKIISAYGQELSMKDVFADFARSHESFTLDQLNLLKCDLETTIYFDSVYANSLRINKNEFVSKKRANFDIDAIDASIDRFCTGSYIAIKEVSQFGSFPNAGFTWTAFLLEQYVFDYSRKYKLIHSGFTASTSVGAIVKRSSQISNFDELIIRVLSDSNISLNRGEALSYLYDAGFLARRYYSNIEQIIAKAKLRRSQKGN